MSVYLIRKSNAMYETMALRGNCQDLLHFREHFYNALRGLMKWPIGRLALRISGDVTVLILDPGTSSNCEVKHQPYVVQFTLICEINLNS